MTAPIVVAVLAAVAPAAVADGSAFKRCRAVVRDGVRNPGRRPSVPAPADATMIAGNSH